MIYWEYKLSYLNGKADMECQKNSYIFFFFGGGGNEILPSSFNILFIKMTWQLNYSS